MIPYEPCAARTVLYLYKDGRPGNWPRQYLIRCLVGFTRTPPLDSTLREATFRRKLNANILVVSTSMHRGSHLCTTPPAEILQIRTKLATDTCSFRARPASKSFFLFHMPIQVTSAMGCMPDFREPAEPDCKIHLQVPMCVHRLSHSGPSRNAIVRQLGNSSREGTERCHLVNVVLF
jgi:hypothetical protein